MAEKIAVLDPVGDVRPPDRRLTTRRSTLDGANVRLLDNTKPNANHLLEQVGRRLQERYKLASLERLDKWKATHPASPEVFATLQREADLVIVALGD